MTVNLINQLVFPHQGHMPPSRHAYGHFGLVNASWKTIFRSLALFRLVRPLIFILHQVVLSNCAACWLYSTNWLAKHCTDSRCPWISPASKQHVAHGL